MSKPGVRTLAWIGSLLCGVLYLAACDAGAKPEPPATAKPIQAKPIAPTPAAATGDADLSYLAADSDLVIHIDIRALGQSKLWPTYVGEVAKLIAPAFAGCDHDPVSHAAAIDIGIQISPAERDVFVFHGVDRDKTLACLDGKKSVTRDGAFVTLPPKAVFTFVDDHTMVMLRSAAPTKAMLQASIQAAADAPLRKNEAFVMATRTVKKPAQLTFVSRPGSQPISTKMAGSGIKFSYFSAGIDLTDQFTAHYTMPLETPEQATQMVTMIKGQLGSEQVKQMFDQIDSHADGNIVTMDIVLSATKLQSLVTMMRSMWQPSGLE